MKEFLELMEKNEELKKQVEKLDAEKNSQPSDYIALAAKYGVQLTEADFKPVDAGELTEDELDAVTGGGDCSCIVGGGGSGDEGRTKTCACIMGGGGETSDGSCRCICVTVGVGSTAPV